jgi:signal transduction histidine kinase
MNATRRRWFFFALVAAFALVAFGWVSYEALASEKRRDHLRVETDRQQRLALALWRVDATVTALLAGESARPWPLRRGVAPPDERSARFVKLRVEFSPTGGVTAAESSAERPDAAARLEQLVAFVDPVRLEEALARTPAARVRAEAEPTDATDRDAWRRAQQLALEDFQFRTHNIEIARGEQAQGPFRAYLFPGAERRATELLFLRRASGPGGSLVQGVWLDWRVLRSVLLESVGAELFPDEVVDLVPEETSVGERALRGTLASMPAALVVRGFAPLEGPGLTATRAALAAGWFALVAAIVAVALLLRAAFELGERRGRFVAAVTHELRTPLTTFCMYAELLESGVVNGEKERAEYLSTLVTESRRLRRIVDHVLAYARMGGGREVARGEVVGLGELVEALRPALERRAAEGGFALSVEVDASARDARVDAAPALVEELFATLVDNACTHAASGEHRLVLSASADPRRARLTLRDFGPGVSAEEARAVFEPFRRGKHAATPSAGGLGLGLALARDWARELGGELSLVEVAVPGAAFELALPRAR